MHVEKFVEAARVVRPINGHLQDSHPLARAELRVAHRLDMLVDHLALVYIRSLERFVGRNVRADVHSMAPFRMPIADTLHVEIVEGLEFDAALVASWTVQDYFSAFRMSRSRSIIDLPLNRA